MARLTHFTDVPLAVMDDRRVFRYALRRDWHDSRRPEGRTRTCVMFVMLNPSTADERVLDPTLRRCAGFADEWGYDGMLIGNMFAIRSADPKVLRHDPAYTVGADNLQWLTDMAALASFVVVGWGADKSVTPLRIEQTVNALRVGQRSRYTFAQNMPPIYCLRVNKDGSPGHPLYLPKSSQPTPWPKER